MAINKESSVYTFVFAIVLVVLVGATLAATSLSLKDTIKKNKNDKKMMDILSSIEVESTRANALEKFNEYVQDRVLLKADGTVVSTTKDGIDPLNTADAFNLDLMKEFRTKISKIVQSLKNNKTELLEEVMDVDTQYPLYKCVKDGQDLYVMPMGGTGLWGPIWGYVSVKDDFKTLYGASFDHQGETPGLGAEINKPGFEKQFKGLEIFDNQDNYVSVTVMKGGKKPGSKNQVDGITGGTITSNGVGEMLYRSMAIYSNYFKTIEK